MKVDECEQQWIRTDEIRKFDEVDEIRRKSWILI